MYNNKLRDKEIDTHKNGSQTGGPNGKSIPQIKVRVGSSSDGRSTDPLPSIPEDGHSNGNISNSHANGSVRIVEVRPAKVRVGHTERLSGNGNGTTRLNGNGLSNGTSVLAEPSPSTGRLTTSRLRATDLKGMRFRLGQEPPVLVPAPSRPPSVHRRELPYFLMRHRTVRARSRVGYTRSQVATARYGSNGALKAVVQLGAVMWMLFLLLGLGAVGVGAAGATWYVSQLPKVDPSSLAADIQLNGVAVQTSRIYDRNSTLMYDLVSEKTGRREELTLNEISPLVISATVAAEDSTFYTNAGVDPVAIVRAVAITLRGDGSSGASTITQQLVRQIVLAKDERERSFTRKIKEAVLAVQLNQTYSKNDIMEMFVNQNYYGHLAYGIGAASLVYFGKPANQLSLSEAALLAGLPQAPTEFDPYVNVEQAKKRRSYVLDQMVKQDMITDAQAADAKKQDVVLKPYKVDIKAPHFVYYVKQYLETRYGAAAMDSGLKIYTTLDLNVQQTAEQVAKDRIADLRQQRATNAAIVLMKPNTGEILGMVGSVDYNNTAIDGQVNVATAERQPGSSFKPITYVTAFKQGWTPGTVVLDTLTSFPNPGQKPYIPKNYDLKDHGWVTIRESLANSLNIPAVKALQFAGIQNTIDTAHDMGIHGLNRGVGWYGLSLTLGGGEVTLLDMTNAYSTFANNGMEVDANPIMRIEDAQGRTIYCNSAYTAADGKCSSTQLKDMADSKPALDPRLSYMITNVMSDNKARAMEFGLNSPLKTSFPSAAKTGTTDDNRDSWTMGYTPNLTVGVWVGNSNNDEMGKVTGAIGAAVIWHNMMEKFYSTPEFVALLGDANGKIQRDFAQPDGLIKTSACSAKGDINDLFLKDTPPKGCITYKDKNQQLHSAPSSNSAKPGTGTNNNSNANPTPAKPRARPTPIPGIGPPVYNP